MKEEFKKHGSNFLFNNDVVIMKFSAAKCWRHPNKDKDRSLIYKRHNSNLFHAMILKNTVKPLVAYRRYREFAFTRVIK